MTENQLSDAGDKVDPAAVIDSEKPACDLLLFKSANKFAEEMIKNIPELHGIAIIPIWMPQLKDVPHGLLRLRNETPPYISALLQIQGNLSAFAMDVQRDMMNQLRSFNQMAQDISTEVKNKIAELSAINTSIAEAQKAQKNDNVDN